MSEQPSREDIRLSQDPGALDGVLDTVDELVVENTVLRAELAQLREALEDRACPCLYVTPCDPQCTCVNGGSSRGCSRCCSYGSIEQRRAKAERLAAALDRLEALEKVAGDLRHAVEYDEKQNTLYWVHLPIGTREGIKAVLAALSTSGSTPDKEGA